MNHTLRNHSLMGLLALAMTAGLVGCPASSPTTAPAVKGHPVASATIPLDAAPRVAVNGKLKVVFDTPMNPATCTAQTFMLHQGTTAVAGLVTYSGLEATFTPTLNLAPNTTYTGTVTTGFQDLAGNALAQDLVWSFTTGAVEQPVVLGAAGNYAVLAGSTVTSTGPTIITGDLGLSSGSAVEGFPPGILNGAQHVSDPAADQAKLDLTTAYNDAAGRSGAPIGVTGNLGGQTLTPGLYKSTDGLEISSGDLTLDAQGNPNAVFIFQMAVTLSTSSGRQVILSGGAKPANIFWQVGTSATLGTTSVFKGNIMADQSIALLNGATLDGRALARIGAVTLEANTVTKPAS